MGAVLVVIKTLIGIDIGDRSPDGIGRVKPTAEVVDIAIAVVIGLLNLNFLIVFDVCYKSDVAISSIVPTGDGTDLWGISCTESRARALAAHMPPFPHQLWAQGANSLAPQVHSPMG